MKTLFITAALLAVSFAASAAAATKTTAAMAQQEATCKAQAAKKFSAIRFLARRDYVNGCMARAANAKAVQK